MKQITTLDEWITAGDAVYGNESMQERLMRAKQQLIDGIRTQDMLIDTLETSKKEHEQEISRLAQLLEEAAARKESYHQMLDEAAERLSHK